MRIVIITQDYPDKNRSVFTFVEQLVFQFASLGNECIVIAPFSITNALIHKSSIPKKISEHGLISIYRPKYISFSNITVAGFNLSSLAFRHAVRFALAKINGHIDVIYCHFWSSAIAGYSFAKSKKLPLIVANGESKIPQLFKNDSKKHDFVNYISGVVSVSTKNREESIKNGLTNKEKTVIFPNSIDLNKFYKKDKVECRRRLGIPLLDFIVIFVGWFNHRKGAKRLSEALCSLDNPEIKAIFIGEGNVLPVYPKILFLGKINHDLMVDYLNCADVFVLPTLNEGCSNAIVEAMACGLPIISSNLDFNHDILNEDNSLLIDPLNISEIAEAIMKVKNDASLRTRMGEASHGTALNLSISQRASNILHFINTQIKQS